jgi:hypothetical protein
MTSRRVNGHHPWLRITRVICVSRDPSVVFSGVTSVAGPAVCRRSIPNVPDHWVAGLRQRDKTFGEPLAAVSISVTESISCRMSACTSGGASVAFRSELSASFGQLTPDKRALLVVVDVGHRSSTDELIHPGDFAE